MLAPVRRPSGYTPRRDCGLAGYERVLARAGLSPVAGIDEAGRGACAGPLVVAAVELDQRKLTGLTGLADSKALTVRAREAAYHEVIRCARAWHVVIIPAADIDRLGLHVCNVTGMRRALAGLGGRPGYVLTDGFPVRGLTVPALAMWQGDQVAACVAAASVIAKVTRDAIMRETHASYPVYGFARHKGYSTRSHMRALAEHGPCPEHRLSFANVRPVQAASGGTAGPGEFSGDPEREEPVCGPWPPGQAGPWNGPPGEGHGPAAAGEEAGADGSGREGPGEARLGRNLMVDLIGRHAQLAAAGSASRAHGA